MLKKRIKLSKNLEICTGKKMKKLKKNYSKSSMILSSKKI